MTRRSCYSLGFLVLADDFAAPVKACQGQTLGGDTPTSPCKALLAGSEKAAAEWELERRFLAFEKRF
jgi:adenosine deaminase